MTGKLIEGAAMAAALSADTFAAGFSYGAGGVKVPGASLWVINLICGAMLGLALVSGAFLGKFLPEKIGEWGCFILLFVLGLVKLLDGITKTMIRKHGDIRGRLRFSLFNFRFVLTLYADPDMADIDGSKTLSPLEAASLAFALSLDALAAGFGTAMENGDILPVFVMAAVMNCLALPVGVMLGGRISKKLTMNVSWLSGAILMAMAVVRLI